MILHIFRGNVAPSLHIFRGNIWAVLHIFRGNIAPVLHIFRGNVVSSLTIPAEWLEKVAPLFFLTDTKNVGENIRPS